MANDFEFPWVKMMNVKPSTMEPGRLGLTHSPEAIHLNHNGDVNASALFCLGEMSGSGVLVLALGPAARDAFVVIKKGSIEYLARASGPLVAEATLTQAQRDRVAQAAKDKDSIEETVPVDIRNAEGVVVARCEITSVLKPKQHQPA